MRSAQKPAGDFPDVSAGSQRQTKSDLRPILAGFRRSLHRNGKQPESLKTETGFRRDEKSVLRNRPGMAVMFSERFFNGVTRQCKEDRSRL